jgi:hypothetical protein
LGLHAVVDGIGDMFQPEEIFHLYDECQLLEQMAMTSIYKNYFFENRWQRSLLIRQIVFSQDNSSLLWLGVVLVFRLTCALLVPNLPPAIY